MLKNRFFFAEQIVRKLNASEQVHTHNFIKLFCSINLNTIKDLARISTIRRAFWRQFNRALSFESSSKSRYLSLFMSSFIHFIHILSLAMTTMTTMVQVSVAKRFSMRMCKRLLHHLMRSVNSLRFLYRLVTYFCDDFLKVFLIDSK